MKNKKVDAIYKGDKFIDLGTMDELANKLNVKKRTIQFYAAPTYAKRNHKNNYVVIKVEDVDDDEYISRI